MQLKVVWCRVRVSESCRRTTIQNYAEYSLPNHPTPPPPPWYYSPHVYIRRLYECFVIIPSYCLQVRMRYMIIRSMEIA